MKHVHRPDFVVAAYEPKENVTITELLIWQIYIYGSEVLIRIGPCIVLGLLNSLIIRAFHKVCKKRKQLKECTVKKNSQNNEKGRKRTFKGNLREEKRLVILLTGIIILFFVCMAPSAVLSILYTEDYDTNVKFQIFRAVANDLELSNFACNFYIYVLCSKEFRSTFFSILGFKRGRRCDKEVEMQEGVTVITKFSHKDENKHCVNLPAESTI